MYQEFLPLHALEKTETNLYHEFVHCSVEPSLKELPPPLGQTSSSRFSGLEEGEGEGEGEERVRERQREGEGDGNRRGREHLVAAPAAFSPLQIIVPRICVQLMYVCTRVCLCAHVLGCMRTRNSGTKSRSRTLFCGQNVCHIPCDRLGPLVHIPRPVCVLLASPPRARHQTFLHRTLDVVVSPAQRRKLLVGSY